MAVVVLYGLPLLLLILPRGALRQDDSSAFAYSRLQLYLAILLVELVAIVVLFNARTTGFGPYEVEGRLSLRYYNFLFPLFLIIVAGEAVQARKGEGDRRWARGVAFALAAFALVAGYVLPHVYAVTSADSPELSGIFWSRWSFRLFAVLAAALLALWAFRPRASAVWYLAVFFPLITVVAQIDHSREAKRSLQRPSLHATAGKFAKGYLGQNADEVTVVTSDEAGRYDARFYLDAPEVAVVPVSPGAPVHRSDVNANHPWVLVIGDHPLTFKPHQVIYRDGFTLAQAYEETVYDARLLTTPALTVEGATATPRGWVSTAEMIRLKLDNPLPKRFLLIADMSLTGARGPGMVDITIGQEKRSVGLPSTSANTALEFNPGPGLSSIEISVSASVASAGQGDGDKPGLRVRSIRIRNLTGE
jgi:phosphoglycerol transferase